jgi:hypothetical protein
MQSRQLPPPAGDFVFVVAAIERSFARGGANDFCIPASAEVGLQRSGEVSRCSIVVGFGACLQASLVGSVLVGELGSWVRINRGRGLNHCFR